jgi:hypothetical protein
MKEENETLINEVRIPISKENENKNEKTIKIFGKKIKLPNINFKQLWWLFKLGLSEFWMILIGTFFLAIASAITIAL